MKKELLKEALRHAFIAGYESPMEWIDDEVDRIIADLGADFVEPTPEPIKKTKSKIKIAPTRTYLNYADYQQSYGRHAEDDYM